MLSLCRRNERKRSRSPATGDYERALNFSDSDSDFQHDGPLHGDSGIAEILQELSGIRSARAAGPGGAAANGHDQPQFASVTMQSAVEQAKKLVLEDVEALRELWRRKKLPALQAGASDVWEQ